MAGHMKAVTLIHRNLQKLLLNKVLDSDTNRVDGDKVLNRNKQSFPHLTLYVYFVWITSKLQMLHVLLLRNCKALCPVDFPLTENWKEQYYFWMLKCWLLQKNLHRSGQKTSHHQQGHIFLNLLCEAPALQVPVQVHQFFLTKSESRIQRHGQFNWRIHSIHTLLGTPVHQHIHSII